MTPQELKNSILQLAIQGKLVEQRPEEGTGEDLYQKIQKEKEALIKAGKIKKEKPLPQITEEEIPFDIPDSWKWVRIGKVFSVIMGQSPEGTSVSESKNGIEFHQGKIYFSNYVILQSPQTTTKPTKIAPSNSLLLCVRAPVGKVNITDRELCIGRGLCALVSTSNLSERFAFYWLQTLEKTFVKKATGTTFKAISAAIVNSQAIPLPPLAEQKRIVERIEELMHLVDQYEEAWNRLEELNKCFPTDLQKSILQYAIQGKLVEQRPEEGTGETLYNNLKNEKIVLQKAGLVKRIKTLPVITKNEELFEIPESWTFVRVNDISSLVTKGTTPRGGKIAYLENGVGFLRAENIAGFDRINKQSLKYVSVEMHNGFLARSVLQEHDILITIAGTLGRTGLVKKSDLPLNANQAIAIIRPFDSEAVELLYLIYALNSPEVQKHLMQQRKITAIPNLTLEIVSNCVIPLPPLAEQKRIVGKLDELLSMCETLQ